MNSKKDFEATARIIAEVGRGARSGMYAGMTREAAFNELLSVLANEFCENYRRENPRFDCARFLKACGLEGC